MKVKNLIYYCLKTLRELSKPSPLLYVLDERNFSRLFLMLEQYNLSSLYSRIYILNKIISTFKRVYLPVYVPGLDELDDIDKIIDQSTLDLHRKYKTKLLFDLSIEAITFEEFTHKKLLGFHKSLAEKNINSDDVYLLNANSKSTKYYELWAEENNITNKINLIGHDFYLFEYGWETAKSEWLESNADKLLQKSYETVSQDKKRDLFYMCLNLRPRKHRSAVVLNLLNKGLLDKGIVTYFGEEFGSSQAASVDTKEVTKEFIGTLPSGENLLSAWNDLESMLPLRNERNEESIIKDLWHRKPGEVNFLIPEINADGSLDNIQTYFEITVETWLTDERAMYITEKTVRPILRLQPFLVVGCPGTLQRLRDYGFKTFSPLINEDYDKVYDKAERLEMLFKEIDRLCSMSKDEIHKLYCDLWPIVEHNFKHLRDNMAKECESFYSKGLKDFSKEWEI